MKETGMSSPDLSELSSSSNNEFITIAVLQGSKASVSQSLNDKSRQ